MLPSPEHLRQNPDQIPETVERALRKARELEHLRAFISLFDKRASDAAVRVRDQLRAGQALPLGGWLVAVKDNIAIEGERLTCASKMLESFHSGFTATAVRRLEAAGVIIIGKTNLDEFAMGSSSENSIFGPVRNPVDPERVAGGSSGGSAVAVATDVVHAALGSDTGGSVRQPAAFCGVSALKPTYGRVSRYGLVAFGSSLDQIGAFANSCERLYQIICTMGGVDARDSSSANEPIPKYFDRLSPPAQRLRIGVPKEYFVEGIARDIKLAVEKTLDHLRASGHTLVDISLPYTKYAVPAYYIIATAEASSNLARYDGVRYGWRNP
ncbi:MAG: amidase, partial [Calditrichota bacterium]